MISLAPADSVTSLKRVVRVDDVKMQLRKLSLFTFLYILFSNIRGGELAQARNCLWTKTS